MQIVPSAIFVISASHLALLYVIYCGKHLSSLWIVLYENLPLDLFPCSTMDEPFILTEDFELRNLHFRELCRKTT